VALWPELPPILNFIESSDTANLVSNTKQQSTNFALTKLDTQPILSLGLSCSLRYISAMAGDPTGDADINENPLVSEFASENSPHVQLHPIVLISQDDHATRYGLRKQGVAIGAILGQQNGKEITMEHAFECGSGKLVKDSGGPRLSEDWFNQVLQHSE
jgi:COP9 signalosome complex subunit 6